MLKTTSSDHITFSHPLLLSYLTACDLADKGWANWTFISDQWCTSNYAIGFLSAKRDDVTPLLEPYLGNGQEPVCRELLIAAKWLRSAPENAAWRSGLMRHLTKVLQNESNPMGLRGRALTAMALSGTASVDVLFRQYLGSPETGLRLLATLGCGLMRDGKAVNDLKALLADKQPNVRRSASLALVAIGNQYAMEGVADTLLHGDEDLRRAAAEALANNLEEGQPTLKEGSTLSDVMVRRAAVYGLRRVHKPWATETLQHIQVTDTQWVVKDAATQALDEMEQPNPRLPRAIPDLTETPWLIAFAGERGIGISPGKPALELLLLALKEGREEQKLAALEYLARNIQEIALPVIFQTYSSAQGDLRESAFNTLWHYASAGVRLSEMR
jgi:HEAT repeat protein